MKYTSAIILMLSTPLLWAEPAILKPESKLWLEGDSTLHPFTSNATNFAVHIDVDAKGKPLYTAIRDGEMKTLKVVVPIQHLKSGKKGLDKNLYKTLKAEEHPDIVFILSDYDISSSTAGVPLSVKGQLTVAGQTRPIDLIAQMTDGKDVRIQGSEELLMSDYGIKPPTIMGAIRTRDRIVVGFDLLLTTSPN